MDRQRIPRLDGFVINWQLSLIQADVRFSHFDLLFGCCFWHDANISCAVEYGFLMSHVLMFASLDFSVSPRAGRDSKSPVQNSEILCGVFEKSHNRRFFSASFLSVWNQEQSTGLFTMCHRGARTRTGDRGAVNIFLRSQIVQKRSQTTFSFWAFFKSHFSKMFRTGMLRPPAGSAWYGGLGTTNAPSPVHSRDVG